MILKKTTEWMHRQIDDARGLGFVWNINPTVTTSENFPKESTHEKDDQRRHQQDQSSVDNVEEQDDPLFQVALSHQPLYVEAGQHVDVDGEQQPGDGRLVRLEAEDGHGRDRVDQDAVLDHVLQRHTRVRQRQQNDAQVEEPSGNSVQ